MIYAESSAVLSWLLGEAAGDEVGAVMQEVDGIVASDLTLLECRRVLLRYVAGGTLTEAEAADQAAALARVSAGWSLLRIDEDVTERAARPFPSEPTRSLDAIHLASALAARSAIPGLRLLTLDRRIRENGERLGFEVAPLG
ncbi:MAG: PIN domain-containing protein [Longimicrobiales bacterium]